MVVYFLRHAEAESGSGNDAKRKLTVKGLEQAEKVGRFLVSYGLLPEAVLTSPVLRAKQTAKLVAKKLGRVGMIEAPWLSCGMSPDTCLEELRSYAELSSLVVVGHEPDLSRTIAAFVGGADPGAIHVRKASLTAIDLRELKPGGGRLQFLIPCRLM